MTRPNRAAADDRSALAALRRWMRENPTMPVFMGFIDYSRDPDADQCRAQVVSVDADAYDLAQFATVLLERSQELFTAEVDPERRSLGLRHVKAAIAALWHTAKTDA